MIGLLLRSRGSRDTMGAFRSPESRSLLVGILGVLGALAVLLVGWTAVLSLLNAWVVVGLTLVLAAMVYVRTRKQRRRQGWIDTGCCAQCGYDLQASASRVCPECGRDAAQDEPVWRKLRREHEAKYGRSVAADARGEGVQVDEATVRRLLARAHVDGADR